MLSRVRDRIQRVHPQLPTYLLAISFAAAAGGIFETTFNNYLDATFHIGAAARGMLEFPRELPGLLCALGAGVLFFMPEVHMAAIAFLLIALGMFGLGMAGPSWLLMLVFMITWSAGTHLSMPVLSSLTMSLAPEHKRGRRLGQVGGIAHFGTIAGCIVVWALGQRAAANFLAIFAIGGAAALLAAAFVSRLKGVGVEKPRPKLIVRRRYWLYYVLELLFGARKQVFLTFGPWVLVKIFGQPPATFAKLWLVSAVVGMFFAPALGQLVDRLGERTILVADAFLIFCVCVAYGFAETFLGHSRAALRVLYTAYIIDQLLFAVGMARATYVSKIAASPTDIAPTLSLGVSINHAVSMSLPTAGGFLWEACGYQYVFLAAAALAIVMVAFTALVSTPAPAAAAGPITAPSGDSPTS